MVWVWHTNWINPKDAQDKGDYGEHRHMWSEGAKPRSF